MKRAVGVTFYEVMVAMVLFALTLGGASATFKSFEREGAQRRADGGLGIATAVADTLATIIERYLPDGRSTVVLAQADRLILQLHGESEASAERTEFFFVRDTSTPAHDDYRLYVLPPGGEPRLLAEGLLRVAKHPFFNYYGSASYRGPLPPAPHETTGFRFRVADTGPDRGFTRASRLIRLT